MKFKCCLDLSNAFSGTPVGLDLKLGGASGNAQKTQEEGAKKTRLTKKQETKSTITLFCEVLEALLFYLNRKHSEVKTLVYLLIITYHNFPKILEEQVRKMKLIRLTAQFIKLGS